LSTRESRGTGLERGVAHHTASELQRRANPFPGFPEGLALRRGARGVAALAKASALAANCALQSPASKVNADAQNCIARSREFPQILLN